MDDVNVQMPDGARLDFEVAIRGLWPELKAYATTLLGGDTVRADDVLQETAIHAWDHRAELPEVLNFRAWMYRVVYFKALSNIRDHQGRSVMDFSPEVLEAISDTAGRLLGEDLMERRLAALSACVSNLPKADRSLLDWRYAEGRSLTELAAKVGRTAAALHQQISRLRRSLRRCMVHRLKLQRLGS